MSLVHKLKPSMFLNVSSHAQISVLCLFSLSLSFVLVLLELRKLLLISIFLNQSRYGIPQFGK